MASVVDLNFIMFGLWSIGIMGINVYLSHVLDGVHTTTKAYSIHFLADILISALAGVITYLLAKTIQIQDIYLVMIAAVIGHLSARVAYKSILVDMLPNKIGSEDTRLMSDSRLFESQLSERPTDAGPSTIIQE